MREPAIGLNPAVSARAVCDLRATVAHAREHGIGLIHVDFGHEHARFYTRCGFRVGLAGILEVS